MSNSFNFVTSRGCICYTGTVLKTGIYKIDELELCTRPENGKGLILIDSVDIYKVDAVTPKDALDDKHAIYIYGKSFGQVSIQGTAYLGSPDDSGGITSDAENVIKYISDWFNTNRVSTKKTSVGLSIATKFKGLVYITKLKFGQAEPRLNTIKFTIEGFVKPD